MKRVVLLPMIFIFIPFAIDSWGADWKFIGGSTFKGVESYSFYDAETVVHQPNGNVKVWVKGIKNSEFEKEFKRNQKKIVDLSAQKVAKGYSPPCAAVDKRITYDNSIDIISWEETANLSEIKPLVKILYEINCKEKMNRSLSVIYYPKDNEIKSSSEPSKWNYTSPETTGETLLKILCKGGK